MTNEPSPTPAAWATADLADEHGSAALSCDVQFRQFGARRTFSGRITTVECDEDNALMREALEEAADGRILVVDGGGSVHSALLGDQMATLAVGNGWTGVVINGAVRDVAVLAGIDLGVKAVGSNPRRSRKTRTGTRDVDVTFGGVTFRPGDLIHSDDDGIVVLPVL
jgi:regulator of ribonuclease activity A